MPLKKHLLNHQEAAEELGISVESLLDLIRCGDLPAVGSQKDLIKSFDLEQFMGKSSSPTLPFGGAFSPCIPYDIEIQDLSESEWEQMSQTTTEHTPYFNQQKQKWCIALSLGKNADGKRIRKIITGASQEAVIHTYQAYLMQQQFQMLPSLMPNVPSSPAVSPQQDRLFSECFSSFILSLYGKINDKTYRQYVDLSKLVLQQMNDCKMSELKKADLDNILTNLRTQKYTRCNGKSHYYSQSSLNKVYYLLKKFIRFCMEYDILQTNLMQGVCKPLTNAPRSEEPVPHTQKEIKAILDAVSSDLMISCWVHIVAEIGCRPGEALALHWSDIDFEKRELSIAKTLGEELPDKPTSLTEKLNCVPTIKPLKNESGNYRKKENLHSRTLKISDETLSAIRKWQESIQRNQTLLAGKKKYNTEAFIFTKATGELALYPFYNQRYKRRLKKAKLSPKEFNMYRFRHTVCTNLLQNGIDLKTVQMILGDNTPTIVLNEYTNIQKDKMLKSSEILSDRMNQITKTS